MLLPCQGLYFTLYESDFLFLMSMSYFFSRITYIIIIHVQSNATYVQYNFCFIDIYIGTDGEKIPNYVGYVEVVRRKMTGREEEKGRSTPLASTHVY